MFDNDGQEPVGVNGDDLNAFEAEFFGGSAEPEDKVETVEDADPEIDAGAEEVDENLEEPEDESLENDETEEEDEGDEPEPEPKKNRKTAKERIQELVAERRAEEQARLAVEQRLAELEARLAQVKSPKEESPAQQTEEGPQAPDPDAVDEQGELIYPMGEFDPRYVADLTRFQFRQELEASRAEEARQAAERQAQENQERLLETWEVKMIEAEVGLPDLREKISVLDSEFRSLEPKYGAYLAETIMNMDNGPEILYYLAENVDEAQKIVASGPVGAAVALGRIDGLMAKAEREDKEKRNKKRVSAAPEPPVTSRGTASARIASADTDDLAAFEKEFFQKR